MARWRLAAPHYLNTPGTGWEYKENNRTTGKPTRKVFPVPQFLHPEDPSDWNWTYDKDSGEIIVCHEGLGHEKDIIFIGDPTPDMIPLDDEAKAISSKLEKRWDRKLSDMPESGYTGVLLEDLGRKLADATATNSTGGSAAMDKLLETMNAMMEQNAKLITALAGSAAERRA